MTAPVKAAFVVGLNTYGDDVAMAARIRQERLALNQGLYRIVGEPERVDQPVLVTHPDDSDDDEDWGKEPLVEPADADTANAYRIELTWQVESAGMIRAVAAPQLATPTPRPPALQDPPQPGPQDAPDPLDAYGEAMLSGQMAVDPSAVEQEDLEQRFAEELRRSAGQVQVLPQPAGRDVLVVFRGAPGSGSQTFDRLEDADGRPTRAGAWIDMGEDGRWALRLTITD